MPTVGKPKIDTRPKQIYMGIRTIAPFKGMFKVVSRIADKLNNWVDENKIKTSGPPFLHYHVIDMRGFMDISYCVPVRKPLPDDGQVKANVLPFRRDGMRVLFILAAVSQGTEL